VGKVKLISWNVNGIRAAMRKGFCEWLQKEQPDIIGLQEVKAQWDQVQDQFDGQNGYKIIWNAAERKGYSGVAAFSKLQPEAVRNGFGIKEFDSEGRIVELEFPQFTFINVYFPNGQRDLGRLKYKLDFYDATLDYCQKLRSQGKKLIICGDYNTAHTEIDLKNPKENEKTSGFLPEERAWIDKFIGHGYVDIFRQKHPDEAGHYSWWTYRFNARARNIGWRIDYFFITQDLVESVVDASILPDVDGSDHCPIVLELKI